MQEALLSPVVANKVAALQAEINAIISIVVAQAGMDPNGAYQIINREGKPYVIPVAPVAVMDSAEPPQKE
jgi:hypothetical protein